MIQVVERLNYSDNAWPLGRDFGPRAQQVNSFKQTLWNARGRLITRRRQQDLAVYPNGGSADTESRTEGINLVDVAISVSVLYRPVAFEKP